MRRKVAAVWVTTIILINFFFIAINISPNVKGPAIIYVDDEFGEGPGNPPQNYTSIQDAIDAASPGDTVYVYGGTYNENIVIDKTINLIGESRENTTIVGDIINDAVLITANYVNITQFTIKSNGVTDWDDGVALWKVEKCNVSFNNIISNDNKCVHLYISNNNKLLNNNITSKGNAIIMYASKNNTFVNNAILDGGIDISGDLVEYWNTHSIDVSNRVNDRSIHYIKNQEDYIIPPNAGQVILANCSNIQVEDQKINDTSFGIHLGFSSNNSVKNNNVSSNYKYGIYLAYSTFNNITNNNYSNNNIGVNLYYSNNNNITSNNASYNEYYGINIRYSYSNLITNNIALYNQDEGVYLGDSKYNLIEGNHLYGNNIGVVISSISDNNFVLDNKIINNGGGISIGSRSDNNIIKRNNVSMNTGSGIYLNNVYYTTISDNNVSFNGNDGIYLYFTRSSKVTDNNISFNSKYGIYLDSQYCTIMRNNFTNNGIFIDGFVRQEFNTHEITTDNLVNGKPIYYHKNQSNMIIDGIDVGQIILANCTRFEVKNLQISNADVGIQIAYTTDSLVSDNYVLNNKIGIFIFQSMNDIITKNNIVSNSITGIYPSFTESLLFYHNNIINNSRQASDSGGYNLWNLSYPGGGNFWSDYAGVDNFSGPNQNIPGSDGFGDTYHNFFSDYKDYYPLMKPYEEYIIFTPGWNLVSIPFIQTNQDLFNVLSNVNGYYDAVQWYDNIDPVDPWKHNNNGKPFGNDRFKLNETMSFWIHITQPGDTIFLYNGTQPTSNQTIQLHPGWNMVGYPSLTNHNRTAGLNNLTFDTHVDAIQWYDAVAKSWHFMGSDDNFVPGRGYWVHSKVEAEWEVPI